MSAIVELGQGKPSYRISGYRSRNLVNNPYWPPELAAQAGKLPNERYVTLLSLALSKTQDDKGRKRCSLYNTDGQIFSDCGIPVVLFMENYDINRSGYHDTKDTLANIDLGYGSALAAIAIETVAEQRLNNLAKKITRFEGDIK